MPFRLSPIISDYFRLFPIISDYFRLFPINILHTRRARAHVLPKTKPENAGLIIRSNFCIIAA
ncbi:MAG TPA: hypothetical protein PKC76_10400 [Saprospiraceae bacterium]|nr:hypothetical protein [Saprospiraceae bacterium]